MPYTTMPMVDRTIHLMARCTSGVIPCLVQDTFLLIIPFHCALPSKNIHFYTRKASCRPRALFPAAHPGRFVVSYNRQPLTHCRIISPERQQNGRSATNVPGQTMTFSVTKDCVMAFSNSLADMDYKGQAFCARCRNRV
jgi:hypothetical protein